MSQKYHGRNVQPLLGLKTTDSTIIDSIAQNKEKNDYYEKKINHKTYGKAKRIVISTPPDKALFDYMKELAERADNLKNVSRTEDNMLKISSDARKASLDMRLVKADAPVNPNGKVAAACKEIAKIHSETGRCSCRRPPGLRYELYAPA